MPASPGILERLGVDAYTLRARIQPAMLVSLPLALCVVILDPSKLLIGTTTWTLVVWAGGTSLAAQLARDRGRKREPGLCTQWGGKPTTSALRSQNAANPSLVARRHALLQRLMPELNMPTPAEEAQNPGAADAIYDTCITCLRNQTRDRSRFPLVFEENCNYGFRRNLWGLKPTGIVACCLTLALVVATLLLRVRAGVLGNIVPLVTSGCVALLLLVLWIAVIRPSWVRVPAVAYADRLLESVESLL